MRVGGALRIQAGGLALLFIVAGVLGYALYQPKPILAGVFHSVAHKSSGTATILRRTDGQFVLRLSHLKTSFRPDLVVCMSEIPDAFDNETIDKASRLVVGSLQEMADQSFVLGPEVDISRYGSVTVWSSKYQVNFATAPLRHIAFSSSTKDVRSVLSATHNQPPMTS